MSAGTDNGDGTWSLEAGDLDGLTVTPATDSNDDFSLSVTVTTTDGDDTATATGTIDVDVAGVADAPTLTVDLSDGVSEGGETAVSVSQDTIDAATDDAGNSVTVSGVPSGAELSAGTDNGDGTWTLSGGDLNGLTITPADGSSDDVALSFEVSGADGAGDTLVSEDFSNGVSGWGNEAESDNGEMEIGDDETATKTFDFGSEHAGQTVTVSFDSDTFGSWDESGDYQDNFIVSANGSEVVNTTDEGSSSHSFTVTLDENGQMQLEMNADTTASDEGMDIDNFVIAAGDDWSGTLATESVDVELDQATVSYDLDITFSLTDTDASETLSITVDGLPDGAELSAGTENDDGTWTLSSGDLVDLSVSVPDGAAAFDIQVSATATEDDGDTNTVTSTVSVEAQDQTADGATLETTAASGSEDQAIALDIDAALIDTDGSESLSVTISDVPDGATLSAGTENDDGTWTLESGDLNGLTITPSADSSDDFQLSVSVTTTEADGGDTSTSTATLDVSVAGVSDAPTLDVSLGDSTVTVTPGETPDATTVFSSSFSTDDGFVDSVDGWDTNSEKIEVWNSESGHTGEGGFIELNRPVSQ